MKPTRAKARVRAGAAGGGASGAPRGGRSLPVGAKEDFFKRHRKDRPRADAAWKDLVDKGPFLEHDTTLGDAIERNRWPKAYRDRPNLYRLQLVYGFRAVYTVIFIQGEGHVVRIDWVGDHKEYDRLFGYSTS